VTKKGQDIAPSSSELTTNIDVTDYAYVFHIIFNQIYFR